MVSSINLSNRYADALLAYTEEENNGSAGDLSLLESFYKHAIIIVDGLDWPEMPPIPGKLNSFLKLIPPEEINSVLRKFIKLAREKLGIIDVEVISAVPLTDRQLDKLTAKMNAVLQKRVQIITRIDSSLLGGLRIVVGYTIIDDTIKRKLIDMKKNAYEGVYFT